MQAELNVRALVDKITLAQDERTLSAILDMLGPREIGKPLRVAFVNAHALNLSADNDVFLGHLLESDYVFRDGSGMKILYKMLGRNPGLNLNGTDLIPRIIDLYNGKGVSLLGTQQPYLGAAAEKVQKRNVEPVLVMDGFQTDEEYLEAAQRCPASLIILAMGMPKQERVAALLARNLDYPCVIVCGGAILDFIGGKVTRAPMVFRRFGMEWAYRLAQEPRRLFKRYIIGNAVFLLRSVTLAVPSGRDQAKSFK